MPVYEYYCSSCDAEFQTLRPISKADEPAPCKTCGTSGQRQLSTFSFKSNTFSAPRLKLATKPFRSHNQEPAQETTRESAES